MGLVDPLCFWDLVAQPGKAGEHSPNQDRHELANPLCSFVLFHRRHYFRPQPGRASQRSHCEDGNQANLLLACHVQPTDGDDGNDQNHQIRNDIDHRRADQNGVLIHAILATGNFVCFAHALGGDGDDQSDGIEQVPCEDKPDGPEDGGAGGAGRNEDTMEKQDNGGFGEEHAEAGDDFHLVKELDGDVSLLPSIQHSPPLRLAHGSGSRDGEKRADVAVTLVKRFPSVLVTFHISRPPP